jgi:hypothetical protein
MRSKALTLKSITNSLGTNVVLTSRDGSYSEILVELLEFDPLKNNRKKISGGYYFRSPKIKTEQWATMLENLDRVDGKFSISARQYTDKSGSMVVGYARFENRDDAALFAWTNVNEWQKWSDEKEAEWQETVRRKPRVKVTKDGRITGTVTVTTLGD